MESRTFNTKRNIISSYIFMIIQIVFQFVSKSAIVYTLGSQYLGLSSLFTSILTVLNVAELGFTTSIVYFMYKPLAENDTKHVCALLAYLKKVYRIVGIAIIVFGLLAIPVLPILINDEIPSNINIYFLYILYLLNTAISYFLFSYKTALLTAIQRLDLTKVANSIVLVVQYALQLVALLAFKNYYLFVFFMLLGTAGTNIFTAIISNHKYPQYKCAGKISDTEKKDIVNKVKGLLICNISVVTYTTLDSVVVSAFVGLISVAIYSNYMTIYKTVNQLIVMIRSAMQSSVGNSVASESIQKNLNDIYLWQFLFSAISAWCASCMLNLFQPFMTIWMGKSLLLPMHDVVLIVVWFSIDIVQQAQNLYLSAAGLWNELRYSYIFNTFCNLVLNVCLGRLWGITGIIIASLVTCVISGTFWQCIIIFRSYFKISPKRYIQKQFEYFGISTFVVSVSYYISSLIKLSGIGGIAFKAVISVIVTTFLIFICYRKNCNFNKAVMLARKILNKQ